VRIAEVRIGGRLRRLRIIGDSTYTCWAMIHQNKQFGKGKMKAIKLHKRKHGVKIKEV